jgi:hypothetical protein
MTDPLSIARRAEANAQAAHLLVTQAMAKLDAHINECNRHTLELTATIIRIDENSNAQRQALSAKIDKVTLDAAITAANLKSLELTVNKSINTMIKLVGAVVMTSALAAGAVIWYFVQRDLVNEPAQPKAAISAPAPAGGRQ